MGLINITDADLKKSATTYRRDLLMMPVIETEDGTLDCSTNELTPAA